MDNYTELGNEVQDSIKALDTQYETLYMSSIKNDAILADYINILDKFISAEIDAKAENSDERIRVYTEVKNKIESVHLRYQSFKDRLMNKLQEIIPSLIKAPVFIINDELLNYIADQFNAAEAFTVECSDILDELDATLAFSNTKLRSIVR